MVIMSVWISVLDGKCQWLDIIRMYYFLYYHGVNGGYCMCFYPFLGSRHRDTGFKVEHCAIYCEIYLLLNDMYSNKMNYNDTDNFPWSIPGRNSSLMFEVSWTMFRSIWCSAMVCAVFYYYIFDGMILLVIWSDVEEIIWHGANMSLVIFDDVLIICCDFK